MTDFGPLDFISLRDNENKYRPLMVLCRAPADDGWLVIESNTAIIYNLFDTVSRLYGRVSGGGSGKGSDFVSRDKQAALLARATWYHAPAGMETVGAPKKRRRAAV